LAGEQHAPMSMPSPRSLRAAAPIFSGKPLGGYEVAGLSGSRSVWCAQELRIPTSPQILHRENTVAGVYGDIAGAREYLHESTEGIIIREEVFGDAVDAEEKTAAPSTQG